MISVEHISQNTDNTDNRLLVAIRQFIFGKSDAFEIIYNNTAPALMAICRRYASNPDEAKDILQDSYIKIYKHLHKFDPKTPFEHWAKRIAINTAIDHYRKNLKKTFSTLQDVVVVEEEEQFVSADILQYDIEKVLLAIQELPDGYRIILNLFVMENKSHREIAEMLNISESTSRSQLSKARKTLKLKFENGAQ